MFFCVVSSTVSTDATTGLLCVAIDTRLFSVAARAFITMNRKTHISAPLGTLLVSDTNFKCSKEADDGNWITGIEEVRFHLRLGRLHHF